MRSYQSNPVAFPRTDDTLYVPVTVHIVGNSDGIGYFSLLGVLEAFCTLNQDFSEAGIQFFIEGQIKYHANSTWYNHNFQQGAIMMVQKNVPNTINCYIVESPAGNCGYSNYNLGIALAKSCISPNDHTWAHEIGHYLSLPHPFSGWEGFTHDYGMPAPPTVNGEPVELLDGSNCQNAGDGFCDTPADYLNYRWPCNLDGLSNTVQFDPSGASFKSDGTLFMSYSLDECSERFSPEQIDAMKANLLTERPNLLYNQNPLSAPDPSALVVVSPLPGDTVETFEEVTFSWEPLPNATAYFLEVTLLANFQAVLHRYEVQGNSFTSNDLKKNKKYFWRVRPYNRWHTCKEFSEVKSFHTGEEATVSATKEESDKPSVLIYPNPVSQYERLLITATGESGIQRVELFSLEGHKVVASQSNPSQPSQARWELSLEGIPAGAYLVRIQTRTEVFFEKLLKL